MRATDVMLSGKVAVVAGFGDVGKGSAASLRGQHARVIVTEIDPICALQAAMEGYEVMTMDEAVQDRRHLRHHHRLLRRHHREAHAQMKDMAIVCNIGHFDSEIQVEKPSRSTSGTRSSRRCTRSRSPGGKSIILLAEGRLVNLGCATGHPELRDVEQLHQPDHGADRILPKTSQYPVGVYTLPKHLDEKVARLHLGKLGVKLDVPPSRRRSTWASKPKARSSPAHYRY
jgi:adenosylhomocysteinase